MEMEACNPHLSLLGENKTAAKAETYCLRNVIELGHNIKNEDVEVGGNDTCGERS
jgi:hypothetical protein